MQYLHILEHIDYTIFDMLPNKYKLQLIVFKNHFVVIYSSFLKVNFSEKIENSIKISFKQNTIIISQRKNYCKKNIISTNKEDYTPFSIFLFSV